MKNIKKENQYQIIYIYIYIYINYCHVSLVMFYLLGFGLFTYHEVAII